MFSSFLLLIVMCAIGYKLDTMDKKLDIIAKELRIDGWSNK